MSIEEESRECILIVCKNINSVLGNSFHGSILQMFVRRIQTNFKHFSRKFSSFATKAQKCLNILRDVAINIINFK